MPILTLERFEQVMQIARLAAEHNIPELSLRAAREALKAGPPVVPANPNENRRVIRMAGAAEETPVDHAGPKVVASLIELERLWQKHNVSDESIYRGAARCRTAGGPPQ